MTPLRQRSEQPNPFVDRLWGHGMILATTPFLDRWEIHEVLETVVGSTVRTRNVLSRMVQDARDLNADATIGITFRRSELLDIATELPVAGTAVKQTRNAKGPVSP